MADHIIEIFLCAKTAASTGAGIVPSLRSIGTVVGSIVEGLVIGLVAKGIINTANKDVQKHSQILLPKSTLILNLKV